MVSISVESNDASTDTDAAVADFESSDLYQSVYEYIYDYMGRYDASHDFNHILRVLALSKQIMQDEAATSPPKVIDAKSVILGALLHDVGDKKYVQPGENAENLVSELLSRHGCPPKLVAKVVLIVQNVSYSNETKRPQLVKAMIAAHPELAIVQDADRLDAIGAVGIGRVFAFGAVKGGNRGLQESIDHFYEKLIKLESMMKTNTGKQLARERTERLNEFLGWWNDETGSVAHPVPKAD